MGLLHRKTKIEGVPLDPNLILDAARMAALESTPTVDDGKANAVLAVWVTALMEEPLGDTEHRFGAYYRARIIKLLRKVEEKRNGTRTAEMESDAIAQQIGRGE